MSKQPIPNWLQATLKRKLNGEARPSPQDYIVASAALAGVTINELNDRFGLKDGEILGCVKRVACEARNNGLPADILEDMPDLRALETKAVKKHAKKRADAAIIRLEDVNTSGLPVIDPENDKSLPAFLEAAKSEAAKTLVPLTFLAMQHNLARCHDSAVSKSLEVFYGVGRRGGPLVALQQNFGGEQSEKGEGRVVHEFERIIMDAEKESGQEGGETTVFDERLLQQQEE